MSNTSPSQAQSNTPFKLKAGLFPFTVLEIAQFDSADFDAALAAKVAEAPAFFVYTPVILGLDKYEESLEALPLDELRGLCRQHNLLPVAIRSADEALISRARELGLAALPPGTERNNKRTEQPQAAAESSPAEAAPAPAVAAVPTPPARTKIITTPIRSGQQVYAPHGDLIVMSSVSAGAEILADGNIHVCGALRGRALAGVNGDTSARIFCQSLEAELISIAGNFKLDEDLRDPHWQQAVQARLDDQTLHVTPLAS